MLRKVWILVMLITLSFQSVSYADELIKYKEDLLDTQIELMSTKSDYYILDGEPGFLGVSDPFEVVSNFFFGIHKMVVRIVCLLIINAFTLNFYDIFSSELVTFLEPLKTVIFDSWLFLVLGISLLHILVQAGGGRTTSSVSELIKLAFVLMFTMVFLAYPAEFITQGKAISSAVADELIMETFVSGKALSAEDGVAVLSNEIWRAQVDRPWQVMNFKDNSDVYYDDFLTYEPGSAERKKATKELRADVSIPSYSWLITTVLIGLAALPELIIFGMLAVVAIGSEPLLLFVIVAAVFVFIMALLPKFGTNIIMRWIEILILVLAIRTVSIAVLTFFLYLGDILYSKAMPTEMLDIIVVNTIKALIVLFIYMFRKTLFRILTFSRRGAKNIEREMNRRISPARQLRNDYRHVKSVYESGSSKVSSFMNKFSGGRGTYEDDYDDYEETQSDSYDEDDVREERSSPRYQKWFYGVKEKYKNYQDNREDFKSKDDLAKEYLRQRYFHEKEEAEKEASLEFAKSCIEPEPDYSEFVRQTMFNYKNNIEPFSKSDRMNVIKEMNNLEENNQDPMGIFDKYDGSVNEDHKQNDESSEDNKQGKSLDEYIIRQEMKQHMNFTQHIDNTSTSTQIAKAYLNNQYMNQKLDAHVKARMDAEKTGGAVAPKYNPFVDKVNQRIKKSHNPFTKDEIASAERKMEAFRLKGIDPAEHIKNMDSEDMSDIMSANENKEKAYKVKDVKPVSSEGIAVEKVINALEQHIDKKLDKAADHNKIDYDQIRQIIKNDLNEEKTIDEIRDDIMALHKEVNQPFDEKKVELLAKRVAETQDFEAINHYVETLERKDTNDDKEDSQLQKEDTSD